MSDGYGHFWFSKKMYLERLQECLKSGLMDEKVFVKRCSIYHSNEIYTLKTDTKEHGTDFDDMVYLGTGNHENSNFVDEKEAMDDMPKEKNKKKLKEQNEVMFNALKRLSSCESFKEMGSISPEVRARIEYAEGIVKKIETEG